MAYIIAEPCIGTKDTACVDACPVDCIHPKKDTQYEDGRPGFDAVDQSARFLTLHWNDSTSLRLMLSHPDPQRVRQVDRIHFLAMGSMDVNAHSMGLGVSPSSETA